MTDSPFRIDVRVAVVAGHAVVRSGLKSLLDSRGLLTVVGEAGTTVEALALLAERHPDVVVFDPDSDEVTLDALTDVISGGAHRVIVYTAQTDARVHQRAFELGVVGLVMKTQSVDALVRAIEKVHAGEVWLDRDKTAELLQHILRQRDPEDMKIQTLTKREREVVELVGQGLKNAVIGERLFISGATVRNHLTSILSKLGLSNRYELAVYSFRHGLILAEAREPLEFKAARLARRSRIQIGRAGR